MADLKNNDWEGQVRVARACLAKKIESQSPLGLANFDSLKEQSSNALELLQSSHWLSERDRQITQCVDAIELLERIRAKVYSSEEVMIAYVKRATLAHKLTNCLMDVDFLRALERARELDRHLASSDEVVGPLHGLPVSIKDLTGVQGMHFTMGYLSWANNVSNEDAVVVESLRKAGAVVFAKTTMPQSGMALETTSPLFGRTLNPRNRNMVAGGSSGGEGALLACRGSLLGIGTDSGGSIRIPAVFNGLYSIKPSSTRISYKGNNNNSGSIGAASSIGPMAHSVRDLRLITKVLVNDEHWLKDAAVVEKPWQEGSCWSEGKLSIGVLEDDGIASTEPILLEALRLVKRRIAEAGHQVTDLASTPFDFATGASFQTRLAYQLGRAFITEELAKTGEPPIKAIVDKIKRDKPLVDQLVENHRNWKQYKDDFLSAWMRTAESTPNKRPIDALLLPVCSRVGFEHDTLPPRDYASIFNSLDYPAATLPVTSVPYDNSLSAGMPIGLQLVSTHLTEEKLLFIAEILDIAMKR